MKLYLLLVRQGPGRPLRLQAEENERVEPTGPQAGEDGGPGAEPAGPGTAELTGPYTHTHNTQALLNPLPVHPSGTARSDPDQPHQ